MRPDFSVRSFAMADDVHSIVWRERNQLVRVEVRV